MTPQLLSSSPFLSLVCFLLVILLKIQSSSSNPYICHPFECGNITAHYPFSWLWEEPHGDIICGHPEFKLNCEVGPADGGPDQITTMMIYGVKYIVLEIKPKAQTLRIARMLRISNLEEVCPIFLNTTFDSQLFNYIHAYKSVTLHYDCQPTLMGKSNCQVNDVKYQNYNIQEYVPPGTCVRSVSVPVPIYLLPAANASLSDWEKALNQGFELQWKKIGGVACENCNKSGGNCGFHLSYRETICYCPHTTKPFFREPCPSNPPGRAPQAPPEKKKRPTPGLVIGVVVGGFAGIAAVGLGIIIIITILRVASRRKHTLDKSVVFQNKKVKNERIVEAFVRNFGSFAPKKYSYSDVKRMTKSFSTKIGQGGYGDVYKGTLPDGRLVAVKFLKQSKGNGDEFMNEIASISRTSHVNIVTLLGFCYERKKQALIYEFMPNGSLDKFIYDEEPSSTNRNLEWKTMYQITIGIARGLEYLHRGCNTRIVHFDIKPHNILLDDDFCPKISDFGLAKLCQQKESIISMLGARGTAGYIAPEVFCRTFGEVSHKSDVYSYGMMILEMVGGRKNIDAIVSHTNEIYFPNWIYKRLEPSKDFEYHGVVTEEEKEMAKKIIVVSMWCIQTIPSDRPAMDKVLEMLEGSLESLQVPPKPSLSVPGRSRKHSIPSSSFSTSTSSYKPASQEEEVCIELNDK